MIEYATKHDTLQKFLADIALSGGLKGETMAGYQEGPDEAVTLSTIHQAKGLEWQIVFLIGLIEGQFPHAKVFDKPQELEEERRLFYVATTRAEQELYLIHANLDNRGNYFNRPSTFIKELPKSVYEKWKIEEDEDEDEGD